MTTERDDEPTIQEAPDESIEGLRARLEEEREKAQGFMQSWQRAAADYQNFKRRVEEDRSESARFANRALVINVLPLFDDLDRALSNVDPELAEATWVDGIRLIHRKFAQLIEMAGAEEIAAEGEIFDPELHEAVAHVPGDENKVMAVTEKGYKLGDRLVRPAKVVVGQGQPQ